MKTIDSVLDALKKFEVDQSTLQSWEAELGLSIPVDAQGRKVYSPHHINLFKNIRKHLALGRTLDQIKQLVSLPPTQEAKPASPVVPVSVKPPIAKPAIQPPMEGPARHARRMAVQKLTITREKMAGRTNPISVNPPLGAIPANRPPVPNVTYTPVAIPKETQPIQKIAVDPSPVSEPSPRVQKQSQPSATEIPQAQEPERLTVEETISVLSHSLAMADDVPAFMPENVLTAATESFLNPEEYYAHLQEAEQETEQQVESEAPQNVIEEVEASHQTPPPQTKKSVVTVPLAWQTSTETARSQKEVIQAITQTDNKSMGKTLPKKTGNASVPTMAPKVMAAKTNLESSKISAATQRVAEVKPERKEQGKRPVFQEVDDIMPVGGSVITQEPAMATGSPLRTASEEASRMVELIAQLMSDKDQLQRKLMDAEKLNAHLYNANTMFNKKVQNLSDEMGKLKAGTQQEDQRLLELMDEKSKLHAQVIEMERRAQISDRELDIKRQELHAVREQLEIMERKFRGLQDDFNPEWFLGDWVETGELTEVTYDNFGISIDPQRHRRFRISDKPTRSFGNSAVIVTDYEYESNPLWRRTETLMLTHVNPGQLEGELAVEFILDNVPVAKAIYRVSCLQSRGE